ncbi:MULTISPECIES: hypothetical protein [Paraburkholderia]|uniref:Uncharacterized protein n=1 Tax=Paraburkholderia ferrariae TaxID=386056 RepID=A0ABU9S1N5_9BURK|nr:hypothetical protein [Paraburkholderia sp. CNPSo 3281]MCP3720806.1 hypothetical protein [Paraburkholderia sp. CNPSo 3281]
MEIPLQSGTGNFSRALKVAAEPTDSKDSCRVQDNNHCVEGKEKAYTARAAWLWQLGMLDALRRLPAPGQHISQYPPKRVRHVNHLPPPNAEIAISPHLHRHPLEISQ